MKKYRSNYDRDQDLINEYQEGYAEAMTYRESMLRGDIQLAYSLAAMSMLADYSGVQGAWHRGFAYGIKEIRREISRQ